MSFPLWPVYPSTNVNILIDCEEGKPVTHRKGFTFRCPEEGGTAEQSTKANILIDSEEGRLHIGRERYHWGRWDSWPEHKG